MVIVCGLNGEFVLVLLCCSGLGLWCGFWSGFLVFCFGFAVMIGCWCWVVHLVGAGSLVLWLFVMRLGLCVLIRLWWAGLLGGLW